MTEAKLKALFAGQDKLRLSLQGMKTQDGYLRRRVEMLEAVDVDKRFFRRLYFLCVLSLFSQACFYITLVIGFLFKTG